MSAAEHENSDVRCGGTPGRRIPHHRGTTGAGGRSVLEGAFSILRALPTADRRRQISDLSSRTGVPRASVYRLLDQLREAGAVDKFDGQWVIAAGLLHLSSEADPIAGLREASIGIMHEIREHTGAMVSVVVRHADDLVAVEMMPGRFDVPFRARAGALMPAGCAAEGVLGSGGNPRAVPAREAEVDGRIFAGITCFAVPVRVGSTVAALQIATPSSLPARTFAPVLHRASRLVEARVLSARREAARS